jgi:hypothetical protein
MRRSQGLAGWALGMAAVAGLSACGTGRMPKPDLGLGYGGSFEVVNLRPTGGRLADLLASAAEEAAKSNLRPYVELTSAWCPACYWLDHSLSAEPMAQVLGGTYLVRIDVDHWEGRLGGSGLDHHQGPLPAFSALSERGQPIGAWIDRADWGSDLPTQAAPVLADFFHWP